MTFTFKSYSKTTGSILYLVFFFLTLSACQKKETTKDDSSVGYTVKDNQITLDENSNIASQLKVSEVNEEDYVRELTTTGTVEAIPNAYAEIAPPFPGRVLKSFVKLGQKVAQGAPIFEMSAPDYFNAEKEYFDSKQEYRQAQLILKRQEDLLKNNVGVQREVEEAQTNFELKKAALANATAALKIYNVDPSKVVLGQPLIVRSPIQGEIVSNRIVLGQYLKEDASPLAIVVELSKVWIVAQVKEKDIRFIQKNDEVEVKLPAADQTIKGKIYHVNEIVNHETRSVEVLIECDNQNRELKPGMYATVLFKDLPTKSILIPSTAIFQKENDQFVFVQIKPNQFEKRMIEVSGGTQNKVSVVNGLKVGESIVTEGGYLMIRN